jgi:hypothetical protein
MFVEKILYRFYVYNSIQTVWIIEIKRKNAMLCSSSIMVKGLNEVQKRNDKDPTTYFYVLYISNTNW